MPDDNNNNQPQNTNSPIDPVNMDDQTPKINPVVEEVLPPMPQEPVISTKEIGVSNTQEEPKTDALDSTPATVTTDSGSAAPNADILNPQVMGTVMPKKKFGGGRVIATILGLFLLVGGVGAGIMLTGQNQNISEKAAFNNCTKDSDCGNPDLWDCHCLNGGVCNGGECVPQTGSDSLREICTNEGRFFCKNAGATTRWTCCECGYRCGSGEIGCIKDDSIKCGTTPPRPECFAVLALYDANDRIITDLNTLKVGQKVFITVPPSYKTLTAEKTRFTVNGVLGPEISTKRNFGNVPLFFQEYTVKSGQTTVKAEMYYQGKWY